LTALLISSFQKRCQTQSGLSKRLLRNGQTVIGERMDGTGKCLPVVLAWGRMV